MLLVNYQIQKTYYIEVLCENQEEPEIQCEGKCHLSKQLAAESTNPNNEPLPPSTEAFEETVPALHSQFDFSLHSHDREGRVQFSSFVPSELDGHDFDFIPPPRRA
jgi:hypothetical protein